MGMSLLCLGWVMRMSAVPFPNFLRALDSELTCSVQEI